MHHKQSEKADKKAGTRPEDQSHLRQVLKVLNPAHMPQVDTPKGRHNMHHQPHHLQTHFKNILVFRPFRSPKFPRKHQDTPRKNSFLPLFALFRCLFDLLECWTSLEQEQMNALAIWRACSKGHPPPLAERQAPSTPIIFRTKNTAKSRLGLIGKNFGKNLWENVSGKRKPPILWKGGKGC